jgi:hypothetical protein
MCIAHNLKKIAKYMSAIAPGPLVTALDDVELKA